MDFCPSSFDIVFHIQSSINTIKVKSKSFFSPNNWEWKQRPQQHTGPEATFQECALSYQHSVDQTHRDGQLHASESSCHSNNTNNRKICLSERKSLAETCLNPPSSPTERSWIILMRVITTSCALIQGRLLHFSSVSAAGTAHYGFVGIYCSERDKNTWMQRKWQHIKHTTLYSVKL